MCVCVCVGHPAGEDDRGAGELHAAARGERHRHAGRRGGPPGEGAQGAAPHLTLLHSPTNSNSPVEVLLGSYMEGLDSILFSTHNL